MTTLVWAILALCCGSNIYCRNALDCFALKDYVFCLKHVHRSLSASYYEKHPGTIGCSSVMIIISDPDNKEELIQ